jgi:ribosomal protein S7
LTQFDTPETPSTSPSITNLKAGRNPVEAPVRTIEKSAPNEDTPRIGYIGVVYRLVVYMVGLCTIKFNPRTMIKKVKDPPWR